MADQAPTFEAFVTSERARITRERDELNAQRAQIDEQLSALDRELQAIDAYESVKAGRAITTAPRAVRTGRGEGTGGTRRAGQRDAVLSLIKSHPDGITPGQILVAMQADTDAAKTSVRNALSALKRLTHIGSRDGKYFAA